MSCTRMPLPALLFAALLALALAEIPHLNKKQIADKIAATQITFGSTVRLKAQAFNF